AGERPAGSAGNAPFKRGTRCTGLDSQVGLIYNQIVMKPKGYSSTPSGRLDATFAALADPTRRAIPARLPSREASAPDPPKPVAMRQPAISKHLKVLERAGLISRGRDGQRRPRRIEGKQLAEATAWLERYRLIWEGNFQRLDALLDELKTRQKKPEPTNRYRRRQLETTATLKLTTPTEKESV